MIKTTLFVASMALPVMPITTLTPGAVMTMDSDITCRPGYSQSVRNVSDDLKRKVFKSYGLTRRPGFEVDHLIPLSIGGSNAPENLWPQSYTTQPYNAHDKDKLESLLYKLVCKGDVSLIEAQQQIRKDWIGLYITYFGEKK